MLNDIVSYCRVVVKLREGLSRAPGISTSLNDFFFNSQVSSWRKLVSLYPQIKISKLFNTATSSQILQWVKKARKSDACYSAPDFLAYFIIDIPKKSA
jgi:hypothetical protein